MSDNIVVEPEDLDFSDTPPEEEEVQEEEQVEEPEAKGEFDEVSKDELIRRLQEKENQYRGIEQALSRQGQELGELRKLSDAILQERNKPDEQEFDFENPNEFVRRAINDNPDIAELRKQNEQIRQQAAQTELLRRHNDFNEVVRSKEFEDWVMASKARQRLYVESNDNLDVDIADELVKMYKDAQSNQAQAKEKLEQGRKETLKAVKSESGSSAGSTGKKIFRRADLLKLQIQDPGRYDEMQDEILAAYAEGRVK